MYSLLSASVLAIDLARHPSGVAVADVVDRVLSLGPAELAALSGAATAPAAARTRVREQCAGAPRMCTLMGGVTATTSTGLPDPATSRTIVELLSETPVGGLADLLALLGREAPLAGSAPVAVQVALDAVTAAWAGREADLSDLATLRAPWARAVGPVPVSLPEATWTPALRRLLDEVSRRQRPAWGRTVAEHDRHRGGLRWSTAMHEACRAALEAGRVTDIARAQLSAARALRLSGASTGPDAHAVGMAVTAAVQATCTGDLVDQSCTRALTGAWLAGS